MQLKANPSAVEREAIDIWQKFFREKDLNQLVTGDVQHDVGQKLGDAAANEVEWDAAVLEINPSAQTTLTRVGRTEMLMSQNIITTTELCEIKCQPHNNRIIDIGAVMNRTMTLCSRIILFTDNSNEV